MRNAIHLTLIFSLLLLSCQNDSKDKLLGNLPSIVEKYKNQIEELQKESSLTTDIKKGRDISLDLIELKNEAELELKSYFNSNLSNKSIPFKQGNDKELFEIRSVKIVNISYNRIDLIAEFIARSDNANPYFSYLKFVDNNHKEIPGWAILISPMGIKAGRVYDFSGSYTGIEKLFDAKEIIVKSREAYESVSTLKN